MPDAINPDQWGAASYQNAIQNLTAPFAGGARDRTLTIDAAGHADVADTPREPLVLAAPRTPLGNSRLRLSATLVGGGLPTTFPAVEFAPYSEAGAFLPIHLPAVAPDTRTAAAFSIALALSSVAGDGTVTNIPAVQIADLIQVTVVEGVTARLLYALTAEKQRIRRQGREIAAMRLLNTARDAALDRLGYELGTPRYFDKLAYDKPSGHIVLQNWTDAGGVAIPEPDDHYRYRLSLYKPFLMATPTALTNLLDGPGVAPAPNAGLFGKLGFAPRFTLNEATNPFAVAIHIVSAGDDSVRTNFFSHIRSVQLLWPQDEAEANGTHVARFLPSTRKAGVEAMRASLRQSYTFPAKAAMAPLLASALDRVARCRRALGQANTWTVLRVQDSTAGSRYELGLGADIQTPSATDLDKLAQSVKNLPQNIVDAEVISILKSVTPQSSAADPLGAWLLQACGLQTVHQLNAGAVYVSHLPTFGLTISGPANGATGTPLNFQANYNAPGDPGQNVVLLTGLQAALAQWTAGGGAPWTPLSTADAHTAWSKVTARAPADPALGIFRAANLAAITAPADTVTQLTRLPTELLTTIQLPAALAASIVAGIPAASNDLRRLVGLLQANHIVSALPLIADAGRVVLVVGVIGLPNAGLNLGDRRATGFRWYMVPLQGAGGRIKAIGSSTVFEADAPGLTAVLVLGYARHGANDPYEFRVELPDKALLNLDQYEFLMNLLAEYCPIGIMANTFAIRQQHVDLDGDGVADPLPPSAARTFRPFQHRRWQLSAVSTPDGNP